VSALHAEKKKGKHKGIKAKKYTLMMCMHKNMKSTFSDGELLKSTILPQGLMLGVLP
jgi:hypothetical protein